MASPERENQTFIMDFLLQGFGDFPELQPLLFLLFLAIYLATMAGNTLIMGLVLVDWHLHTPMYFFLGNLSCLETCYSSTILPRLLTGLLTGDRTISLAGCLTQYYCFGALQATECLLLATMSYDRYVSICNPLHSAAWMSSRACIQLASGSWIGGFLGNSITTLLLSQLTFCGPNGIDHFFCDFVPLVKLSCDDPRQMEILAFTLSLIFSFLPFLLTVASYACILSWIPSTAGRQKTFSTCSCHLLVVSVYYGTLLAVYMFPTPDLLSHFKIVLSVAYTVLTPLANPLIYSLRNREVQKALSQARRKFIFGPC